MRSATRLRSGAVAAPVTSSSPIVPNWLFSPLETGLNSPTRFSGTPVVVRDCSGPVGW